MPYDTANFILSHIHTQMKSLLLKRILNFTILLFEQLFGYYVNFYNQSMIKNLVFYDKMKNQYNKTLFSIVVMICREQGVASFSTGLKSVFVSFIAFLQSFHLLCLSLRKRVDSALVETRFFIVTHEILVGCISFVMQ